MPWSGRSKRVLTDSLATIWLTVKCLPTSRRNSRVESVPSQSALLRSRARPSQVEELAQLGADALEVALDRLEVEQLALVLLAARVADHAGAAAGEGDRPVAGLLEPAQRAQLEEVAHVEAVRRRVEAGVDREAGLVEPLRELGVGHLVDQAAEGEVLRERGHASTLPYAGRLIGRMVIGTGHRDRRLAAAADGGRVAPRPAGDAVPGRAGAGGGGGRRGAGGGEGGCGRCG